jgi:hypothetical protein
MCSLTIAVDRYELLLFLKTGIYEVYIFSTFYVSSEGGYIYADPQIQKGIGQSTQYQR